jgi:hypothetical protein
MANEVCTKNSPNIYVYEAVRLVKKPAVRLGQQQHQLIAQLALALPVLPVLPGRAG